MKITDLKSWKTRSVLLGSALVIGVGGSVAIAQARYAPQDPSTMPEFHGKVVQYDLTPRGDVDGLILADGAEVHFPPHLGSALQAAVHPGDEVTIRGEKDGPVVRAGSIAVGSGAPIVDRGPPAGGPRPGDRRNEDPARQAMQDTGVVKMALHGPRGELNGALLEDGTMVHLPPSEATRLADTLKPGQPIAVRGEGVDGATGRSIGAQEVGPSMDKLTKIVAPPRPPRGPGPEGRGPEGRGPEGRGPDGQGPGPQGVGPQVPKPNNI